MLTTTELKAIVEAILMAGDGPLSLDRLIKLFDQDQRPSKEQLREVMAELANDYAERGVELQQVASGFRFQVKQAYAPWIAKLTQERPPRYSRALLETLALIVYKQPVTRAEIEAVRGVAVSSSIINTLLEREWIKVVGYREVPGKPALYASTKLFLDYFNLKNLDELPPLADIRDLDEAEQQLGQQLKLAIEGKVVEADTAPEIVSKQAACEPIDD